MQFSLFGRLLQLCFYNAKVITFSALFTYNRKGVVPGHTIKGVAMQRATGCKGRAQPGKLQHSALRL